MPPDLGSTAQGGKPLPFINECFYPAGAVAKGSITHSNDWKLWTFPGRVVPNPIPTDIESMSDIINREKRVH